MWDHAWFMIANKSLGTSFFKRKILITFCPAWVIRNCRHDIGLVLKRCFLNNEKINNVMDTCTFNPHCCLIMSMTWLSRKILGKATSFVYVRTTYSRLPYDFAMLLLFHVHNAVRVHLISWEPVLAASFSSPLPPLLQFQNYTYKHLHVHLLNLSSCMSTNTQWKR